MITRNYKQMRGRLRVDVANNDAASVLMNEIGRDFVFDDAAK
jgi:hypothetical protein